MLVIVSFFLVVVLVRRVFDWQWPSDRGPSNYSSSHMEQHSRTTFKLIFTMFLSPSGDLGIGLVWHNLSPPPHSTDFLVPLLKSSSNWTKFSMRGPQLFSGWYQMILGVFRCTQLFSDVFRLFSNCFPTMFSDCWNPLQAELNYLWWVLSCSQDDIRWF